MATCPGRSAPPMPATAAASRPATSGGPAFAAVCGPAFAAACGPAFAAALRPGPADGGRASSAVGSGARPGGTRRRYRAGRRDRATRPATRWPGHLPTPLLTNINDWRNYCRMVTKPPVDQDVGPLFEALSDATRRQVVQLLVAGPLRAGQLADGAGTSAAAMSRHLRVLLRTGIVTDERIAKDARGRLFRLRPQSIVALQAWLDQLQAHWNAQLQSFKWHVEGRQQQ